jgi:hypothetical protein
MWCAIKHYGLDTTCHHGTPNYTKGVDPYHGMEEVAVHFVVGLVDVSIERVRQRESVGV